MGEERFRNIIRTDSTSGAVSNLNIAAAGTTLLYHPGPFSRDIAPTVTAEDMLQSMVFGHFPNDIPKLPPITDYAIYNNRVLIVYFADGTFTKCVAESEAEFDFFTGLAFCLFKKMLGKDGHKRFNAMMRKAIKECDKVDERHEQDKAEEERRKAKQRKAKLKRAAKAAKARQEQINTQSAAVLDALRKFETEKKN